MKKPSRQRGFPVFVVVSALAALLLPVSSRWPTLNVSPYSRCAFHVAELSESVRSLRHGGSIRDQGLWRRRDRAV